MSDQFFYGGAWRAQTRRVRFIAGAWRTATRRKMYKGGVWLSSPTSTYTSPLSASASPGDVTGSRSSALPVVVTSNSATVTPSGGLAPYTYSWAGGGTTATKPTNATTAFYQTLSAHTETLTSAICTVTDSLGATATATVDIDLTNGG